MIYVYYNEITGEYMSKAEFVQYCVAYINSKEWENGSKPLVNEIMLNTDHIIKVF